MTPFSRAEFNFVGFRLEWVYFNSSTLLRQYAIPGSVTYDISLIYGYNVGMEISSADASCDAFACTISSGCVSTLYFLSYFSRANMDLACSRSQRFVLLSLLLLRRRV